jgi:hypothetical protein
MHGDDMKNYEPDDGALTRDQIEQIRDRVRQQDEIELVDFIRLAVLEEREACAKLCDDLDKMRGYSYADKCAAAIRARGNK